MSEEVALLPFDNKAGFPQRQRFKLEGVTYEAYYRRNYTGEYPVLELTRYMDGTVLFSDVLTTDWPRQINDPDDGTPIMGIWPRIITEKTLEVWLFYGEDL